MSKGRKCRYCSRVYGGRPDRALINLNDHIEREHPEHHREAAFNAAAAEAGQFEAPCVCGHIEWEHGEYGDSQPFCVEGCKCSGYRTRRPDCGDIRCD